MELFLQSHLGLQLHPEKIVLRKWHWGVDWLGYVLFPTYQVLRPKTARRLIKKIVLRQREVESGLTSGPSFDATWQSYLGMLSHCRSYQLWRRMCAESVVSDHAKMG
jgi:hypothetical protein